MTFELTIILYANKIYNIINMYLRDLDSSDGQ